VKTPNPYPDGVRGEKGDGWDEGYRAALKDVADVIRADAEVIEASFTSTKARRLLTVEVMRTVANAIEEMP